MEAAFPNDRYIAVRGASGNSETVKDTALWELSLYFQTQISSRTDLAESYAEPWQNSDGMWEAIAYIDRNEAWIIFEPRLTSRSGPFMAVFEAAEADPESLRCFHVRATRLSGLHADAPSAPGGRV